MVFTESRKDNRLDTHRHDYRQILILPFRYQKPRKGIFFALLLKICVNCPHYFALIELNLLNFVKFGGGFCCSYPFL